MTTCSGRQARTQQAFAEFDVGQGWQTWQEPLLTPAVTTDFANEQGALAL